MDTELVESHRNFGKAANGRTWALLEQSSRTAAEALGDFDLAYACEAMARAHSLNGDAGASEWRQRAAAAGAEIQDPEDRGIFESDLAKPPW